MVNPKKTKFNATLERLTKDQFGKKDILSKNLTEKTGSLEDKEKITIRLDLRVIEAAKSEAEQRGIGYQKIINDRLLELYSIEEASYLKVDSSSALEKLSKQIEDLNQRLRKVEGGRGKKRA